MVLLKKYDDIYLDHILVFKISRGPICKLQLYKYNHLARQESIPVALYTGEKMMDDFIAVDEVKHTI